MTPSSKAINNHISLSNMHTFKVAWKLAKRELKNSFRGFRNFLACIIFGVAAIAGVGSISEAFNAGLKENAQSLLGADIEVRTSAQGLNKEQILWIEKRSETLTNVQELRAMAYSKINDQRILVELKGVGSEYPLYGSISLTPNIPLPVALESRKQLRGAAVEKTLLSQIGVNIGDIIGIGDINVQIRAIITREPDRVGGALMLGPRLMVSSSTFNSSGLVRPGSMLQNKYRVRLKPDQNSTKWIQALKSNFPGSSWRISDLGGAQPSTKRFIQRLSLFLKLVSLSALVIGGVGVFNAVSNFFISRNNTIAILKFLGATRKIIFLTYFFVVVYLSLVGIFAGLIIGGCIPVLITFFAHTLLPIPLSANVYPSPLLIAAAFGGLISMIFTILPLARLQDVSGARILRDIVAPTLLKPQLFYVCLMFLSLCAAVTLTLLTMGDLSLARWFIAGIVVTFLSFWTFAKLIMVVCKKLYRPQSPILNLALLNLTRPGAPTAGITMSLGVGLSMLITVALLNANITRQINHHIPKFAPAFFFFDIQTTQIKTFEQLVAQTNGAKILQKIPNLRGRLTHIQGIPIDKAKYNQSASWFVNGERGLTYAATPPGGALIVGGHWWPDNYSGEPAISLDASIANALDVGLGDTLTFNILGRNIVAKIMSLREIEWAQLQLQFATIFAPGALEDAPQTYLAAVSLPPENEEYLHKAVTNQLRNVSAIRTRDILETVMGTLMQIGIAIQASAFITIVSGILVLVGAVAAGYRRRLYDSVILKAIGATRLDITKIFIIEYITLGLATGILAALVGTVSSFAVTSFILEDTWEFDFVAVALTGLAGIIATLTIGLVGNWKILGSSVMAILRSR